ncbi:hypothetical protein NL676_001133 [Syzygium grande]|nr:hypothetical protein NL676_001133 [Syzygium grande]
MLVSSLDINKGGIRSFRLQLEKHLQQAHERKASLRKVPERRRLPTAAPSLSALATSGPPFDCVPETLRKRSLVELGAGSMVNLERAVQPTSRMGEHCVQGHMDGTGEIVSMEPEADSLWVKVRRGRSCWEDGHSHKESWAEGEIGGGHIGEVCGEASQKQVRQFDEDFSNVKITRV